MFRLGLFWRWLYLSVGLHGFVGSCSICRLLGSSIGEQINLLRLARLYLCSLLLDSLCRRFRLIDTGFLRGRLLRLYLCGPGRFFLGLTLGFKLALANLAWVVVGAAALCQGGDAAFGLNRLLGDGLDLGRFCRYF